MKSVFRYFSFIVLPVLIGISVGCNRRAANAVDTTLDAIESIVLSRPDSALHILNRLDSLLTTGEAKLQGGEQTARYALLKSQTYDKNWIDLTSDSLIRIAFDYYTQHGNDQERMKSWFYLAAIHRNNRDYNSAFKSYGMAEELALQLQDTAMLIIIYGNLAWASHYSYSSDAMHYAGLSYDLAQKAGDEKGKLWGMAYMAQNHSFAHNDAKADSLLSVIFEHRPKNDAVIQYCLPFYIRQCIRTRNYDKADSLFKMKKTPNRGTDYVYKAYTCEMKGMPDDADICLDSAELTLTTLSDQVFLCEGKSRILEHRKDYEGALHFMKMRIEKQNSIIYSIYGQSVSAAQRDFLLQQKERVEHRGEMHRLYLTFGLILLIILLTAIILFSYYKQKESCRKIEQYLEDVSVLTHTLTVKDSRIRHLERELSEKFDNQQSQQTEMQAKVQKLFAGQFAFINGICSDMQNNKFDQKQVYERLQREIQKLASDEQNQSQLEAVIDEYFNDIMKRVKATGIINGNGAQLLSYMIARFRNRSIMMLMNIDDLATLKKRKTRLRERLHRSGLAEAEEALSYLPANDE